MKHNLLPPHSSGSFRPARAFLTAFVLLTWGACHRLAIPHDVNNTPTACFESMWKTVDEHYSFFEYKQINWDSMGKAYRARVNDKISQDSLYTVLSEILYQLRDGHVNLFTPFNKTRNWTWFENYASNFNKNFVEINYCKSKCYYTGPLVNTLIDSVGYLYYGSFSSGISPDDLDFVLNRFKNTKGLILDVRDNGGGNVNNIYTLMNRFVKKKVLVGRHYTKNGPGHNDFAMSEVYAEPTGRVQYTDKPVVILTNRRCYSATNFFAGFMSTLPNVTIMGDQTGGGGGMPISRDLPNGWTYRFSATRILLPDSTNIEHGVKPRVYVSTGPGDELQGRDAIIEKALQTILGKTH